MTPLTKRHPPRGLGRRLFRLPLSLYRVRLDWLLGERFLLLTHIGRKSGQPRQTVLEVVYHDTATDTYFIASGWGERSDWIRNVQKTPVVRVDVGKRHFVAMAKRLTIEQAQSTLFASARHHPWVFPILARLIVGRRLKPTDDDCLSLAQSVPVIGLVRCGTYGRDNRVEQVTSKIFDNWFIQSGDPGKNYIPGNPTIVNKYMIVPFPIHRVSLKP
jgi:deazaflavin-dependent oxidoreductase (nitroreductase family)